MTFHDALRILGLESYEDSQTIRRCYLRLTKIHRPEVDPEGFRKIRRAYEILIGEAEPDDEPEEDLDPPPAADPPPSQPPKAEESSPTQGPDNEEPTYYQSQEPLTPPGSRKPTPEEPKHSRPPTYTDENLIRRIKEASAWPRMQFEDALAALTHPNLQEDLILALLDLHLQLEARGHYAEAEKLFQALVLVVDPLRAQGFTTTAVEGPWELAQEIPRVRSRIPPKILQDLLTFRLSGGTNLKNLVSLLKTLPEPQLLGLRALALDPSIQSVLFSKILPQAVDLTFRDLEREKAQQEPHQHQSAGSQTYQQNPLPEFDWEALARPIVKEFENFFNNLFGGKK